MTNLQYQLTHKQIIDLAITIYMKYENFLPKHRVDDGIDDYIKAVNITIYGTKEEWNELIMGWLKDRNLANKKEQIDYWLL